MQLKAYLFVVELYSLWFLQPLKERLENVDDSTSSDNSPQHSGANTVSRAVGSPEYMKNNRSFKRLWGK